MIAFGEGFSSHRPPVDLKTTGGLQIKSNGNPEIQLNPSRRTRKWGIHSTYSDNLMMLTLNRGWHRSGSARKTAKAGVVDNDRIEVLQHQRRRSLGRRRVVSQRVNPGMTLMYHRGRRSSPRGPER